MVPLFAMFGHAEDVAVPQIPREDAK